MVFWIVAALMTCAVLALMTRPLWRPAPDADLAPAGHDVAVYRDQLAEIETDLARGLISSADADAARIEISRRLLAADEAARQVEGPARRPVDRYALVASAVLVPVVTLAMYLAVGAPAIPDMPRAARLQVPIDQAPVMELVARVEARLKEHPEDVQGWDVIAPIYIRLGRFQEAYQAYQRAAELDGRTALRIMGMAQAVVGAMDGRIGDTALKLYDEVARLDPARPEPSFVRGIAAEQKGQRDEARKIYETMLSGAPADAPWRGAVEQRLASLAGDNPAASGTSGPAGAPPAARGPSADRSPGNVAGRSPKNDRRHGDRAGGPLARKRRRSGRLDAARAGLCRSGQAG